MTSKADEYALTSREFLTKAEEALAQDDLPQASEKLWGAAAQMVKGIAERRGWRHSGHRELFQVVNRLTEETGDGELRTLFDVANSLHSNFYENWMPRDWVQDRATRISEFIRRLERIA
jgi:Archaeal PaREP1/PaREP8 family